MAVSRRDLLKFGGAGAVGAALFAAPWERSISAKAASKLSSRLMPVPYRATFARPERLVPSMQTGGGDDRTDHYTIKEQAGTVRMIPTRDTTVWGYGAGAAGLVPGPTIDVEQGTRVELTVRNKLPAVHPLFGYEFATSVHLHGSASLPQYDGYANDLTAPGFKKTYHYPNFQPARTLWYHDHAVHRTATNAYGGLAAQYHLHDDTERALLPQGHYDVPLTVSDVMFAANGQLGYDDDSHSGLWGDVILVNGRPWPVMQVKPRIYRFRILNASIARSYRFQLSSREGVTMVATDGGLMPVAQPVLNWRHAPAERYEVLIDFSKYAVGSRVTLENLSNPNNVTYTHTRKVMAFDVVEGPPDQDGDMTLSAMPAALANSEVMSLDPSSSVKTRRFRLKRDLDVWTIDGHTWADVVDSGYERLLADPDLGDTEIWEWENSSGGWFHPVHIHLVDFKILSRNKKPAFAYEQGPKDVVYVGEGETVRLLMKFGPHEGKYMIHCHNLPHEDHDMMGQFRVGPKVDDPDAHHPIYGAPPEPDPGS